MKDIGLREAFNDLWVWDTKLNDKWIKIEGKGQIPKRRMFHEARVLGGIMLLLGGVNTEARGAVLDDFNLFDFQSETWLDVVTVKYKDKTEFKSRFSQAYNINEIKD